MKPVGYDDLTVDKRDKKSDATMPKKTGEKKQRDCRRKQSVEGENKITGIVTPLKVEKGNREGMRHTLHKK
ncbi:hypothetical protein ACTXT7_005034 [Hymenolepis weldensis]